MKYVKMSLFSDAIIEIPHLTTLYTVINLFSKFLKKTFKSFLFEFTNYNSENQKYLWTILTSQSNRSMGLFCLVSGLL